MPPAVADAVGSDLAASIAKLREACAEKAGTGQSAERFAFGCEAIDRALPAGGLLRGAVHEFLGLSCEDGPRRRWTPPLSVVLHLAAGVCSEQRGRAVVWVGEKAWPFPGVLFGSGASSLGRRSIFVRARGVDERVWAGDLALRSGAAAVVLIDGSGVDMSGSRRLQLAAEAGGREACTCLMVRPPWERAELSAAATRWFVGAAPAEHGATPARRWVVELLRCKGAQVSAGSSFPHSSCSRWILEPDHATRHGLVAADLLDGPGEAEAGAERRRLG